VLGINQHSQLEGIEPQDSTVNYLVGPKSEWKTGPSDGVYNPVILAYDNCGHALTSNDPIQIQRTSGGTGSIGVTWVNNTILSNPIPFKATTQVRNCRAGIAAMRIYTGPAVNAYTVNASSIDRQLTLSAGTHNTVIQAWDNRGRVYRAPATIPVQ